MLTNCRQEQHRGFMSFMQMQAIKPELVPQTRKRRHHTHPMSWRRIDLNSIWRTRLDSAAPMTAKLHCCRVVARNTPHAITKNIQE